jgi:hexose-6-phosphate dehydrogenase
VERIEVFMKETETCEGRTAFYENYGIVRDVLQNHLSEALALIAMDLPTTLDGSQADSDVSELRIAFLRSLQGPVDNSAAHWALGQYAGYRSHVAEDAGTATISPVNTPTAAAVTLFVQTGKDDGDHDGDDTTRTQTKRDRERALSRRWANVPFVVSAGKALDERAAYANVIFREPEEGSSRDVCSISFSIQGGDAGTSISVSKCSGKNKTTSSAPPSVPAGWTLHDDLSMRPSGLVPNAYKVLIDEVLRARQAMFMSTEELLALWRIWTPVVDATVGTVPAIYEPGFSGFSSDKVVPAAAISAGRGGAEL